MRRPEGGGGGNGRGSRKHMPGRPAGVGTAKLCVPTRTAFPGLPPRAHWRADEDHPAPPIRPRSRRGGLPRPYPGPPTHRPPHRPPPPVPPLLVPSRFVGSSVPGVDDGEHNACRVGGRHRSGRAGVEGLFCAAFMGARRGAQAVGKAVRACIARPPTTTQPPPPPNSLAFV